MTEALADLLTRMPLTVIAELLDHAFEGTNHPRFADILSRGIVKWETQVTVPGGIADLVLSVANRPVIVFENKTWSGFQDHSTDHDNANQLTTYCMWLAEKTATVEECAVLLLTGTTSSPDGYHDQGGPYAVRCRGQVTWARLSRWLTQKLVCPVQANEQEQSWRTLAIELVEFLREKKLSSEMYNPSDVSVAHLFVPAMDRWLSTFDGIWSGSHSIWSRFLGTRLSDVRVSTEGGMMWQWRYATEGVAPIRSYVGLGIRFPDQSEWYHGLGLPETPHFLMLIATDSGCLRHQGPLQLGWV